MDHAYLEQCGGLWTRTNNIEKALDHQGRMIVCDDAADDANIAARVAAKTGCFVLHAWHEVFTSDVPIFTAEFGLTEAAQRLARSGHAVRVLCKNFGVTWPTEKVGKKFVRFHSPKSWCTSPRPPKDSQGPGTEMPGMVLEDSGLGNCIFNLIYDPDLWAKAKEKLRRRDKRANDNSIVDLDKLWTVAQNLSTSMGMGDIKRFRCSQFLMWVLAHDQFHGRRATNRIVLSVAKAWAKNPDGHVKKHRQRIPKVVLEKLEERFRKIVRFPTPESAPV